MKNSRNNKIHEDLCKKSFVTRDTTQISIGNSKNKNLNFKAIRKRSVSVHDSLNLC